MCPVIHPLEDDTPVQIIDSILEERPGEVGLARDAVLLGGAWSYTVVLPDGAECFCQAWELTAPTRPAALPSPSSPSHQDTSPLSPLPAPQPAALPDDPAMPGTAWADPMRVVEWGLGLTD